MFFSRFRIVIYLDIVQRRMTNLWSAFNVRSSGKSRNEMTGLNYTENIAYNFTLYYGTC